MSELTQPQSSEDLLDQACAWVVRLRADNVAESVLEQFADWLTTTPQHRQAFDQVAEMWGDLGIASQLPLSAVNPAQKADTSEKPSSWLAKLFGWKPIGGLAVATAVAVAVTLGVISPAQPDIYQTTVGESLAVTLDDGSKIELNTNSTLEVQYKDDLRWLHLVSGEAYFSVAKDKQRPFVVELDGAQARAVGTEFNIFKDVANSAEITVTEGTVQVTNARQPSLPKFVEAHQAITFDSKGGLQNLRTADSDIITAWRQSQIVFDNTPLSDVISTLNRYSKTPIELTAADSAKAPISGTFSTERPLETAQAVAEALTLTAVLKDNRLQLEPANPPDC
ncbi:FecR domain-containing protein [bacterium SCSIO 12696]|nr:FecR domain-containing protein [bacterium SCSIO 12696]